MEQTTLEPIKHGMDVWTEYGFAGLFVFVFLIILFYLLFELRRSKRETLVLTERCIIGIEQFTTVGKELIATNIKLKETLENTAEQSREFLIYMKARDQFFGSGR